MKVRVLSLVVALALVLGLAVQPAQAQTAPALSLPVTGTIDGGGAFNGAFDLTRFAVQNGELVAVGTLSGTLTDVLGNVIGTVANVPVAIPVTSISSTCEILDLELGPLDLDLLGLVVHLDRINLEITAESGSGNLLGNLLCAVTRLLDSNASLGAVSNLLNAILRALG